MAAQKFCTTCGGDVEYSDTQREFAHVNSADNDHTPTLESDEVEAIRDEISELENSVPRFTAGGSQALTHAEQDLLREFGEAEEQTRDDLSSNEFDGPVDPECARLHVADMRALRDRLMH